MYYTYIGGSPTDRPSVRMHYTYTVPFLVVLRLLYNAFMNFHFPIWYHYIYIYIPERCTPGVYVYTYLHLVVHKIITV